MTRLDAALAGCGGALLGLGGALCLLGETDWGGVFFAAGAGFVMHVALRWRRS